MVVESIPIEMFAGLFLMIFKNKIKIAIISPHFISSRLWEEDFFNKTFKIPKIVVIDRYLVFGYL